ncbi:aromatic amino acid lyase [Streptomyces sp. NPDC060000]|uniref:aromatic amino acid lyase n=1 Tax=Streptomyces sp. NPDC060000 TaxID=3347031 RepID=UPI0036C73471
MLAVRANQLLAGGSGIQPALVDALTDALRLGLHPAVNESTAAPWTPRTSPCCRPRSSPPPARPCGRRTPTSPPSPVNSWPPCGS